MSASASELCFLSAAEQAGRVRAGETTSRALVEAYLERIDALDGALGAYVRVDREGALAAADAVDRAVEAGEGGGPLAGVPIALKDILVTEGLETTAASKILAGWEPPYDGTAVEQLRRAGAVILGKLNMDEFAMGSSNEASGVKPCKNPWDLERVPGGSSGGSAAAVAAGLCAASLGTDTGGSIRQPASLCGVTGIKPTYGRVSRYGVIAFASSLDQVGPIARSVEDAALLLEVVAGFDDRDATSIEARVPDWLGGLDRGVDGLKIGLPKEYFEGGADKEVIAAVEEAVRVLEKAGARPVEISLPHTEYALPAYYLIAPAEASSNLARYDGVRYGERVAERGDGLKTMYEKTRGAGFGPEVKRRIMLGTFALRSGYYEQYYGKAQRVRTLVERDFRRAFEEVDAIVSPTSPTPAFRAGEKKSPLEMYMADVFTLACNLAGIPGMSVPCGQSGEGLPIGLQILGQPLDEGTVFRVGHAYERATDWAARRPPDPKEVPDG